MKALRGIVRLQALVRGRLVRRQLAVTLKCMQALVRVQERAWERRARCSADGGDSQDAHAERNGLADPMKEAKVHGSQHYVPFLAWMCSAISLLRVFVIARFALELPPCSELKSRSICAVLGNVTNVHAISVNA